MQRHPDIEPEEIEEVFATYPPPLIERVKSGRYRALGTVVHGRRLTVIFVKKGSGIIRPITARVMTPREKRRYKAYKRRSGYRR
jgi:uncharacterized DUF497 family protein